MRINPPNDTETTTTMIPTPDAPKHIKVEHVKHVNNKKSTKPKQNKKVWVNRVLSAIDWSDIWQLLIPVFDANDISIFMPK